MFTVKCKFVMCDDITCRDCYSTARRGSEDDYLESYDIFLLVALAI